MYIWVSNLIQIACWPILSPISEVYFNDLVKCVSKRKPYSRGVYPDIILYIRPANERRRYIVTASPIAWAHTQNDPCAP